MDDVADDQVATTSKRESSRFSMFASGGWSFDELGLNFSGFRKPTLTQEVRGSTFPTPSGPFAAGTPVHTGEGEGAPDRRAVANSFGG